MPIDAFARGDTNGVAGGGCNVGEFTLVSQFGGCDFVFFGLHFVLVKLRFLLLRNEPNFGFLSFFSSLYKLLGGALIGAVVEGLIAEVAFHIEADRRLATDDQPSVREFGC